MFPQFSTVIPDLWGHGKSKALEKSVEPQDIADGLAHIIRTSGPAHCVGVGHSMGCGALLLLASKYPELIDGLVMVEGVYPKAKMPAATGSSPTRRQMFENMLSPRQHEAWARDVLEECLRVPDSVADSYLPVVRANREDLVRKRIAPTIIISREVFNGERLVPSDWQGIESTVAAVRFVAGTQTHFVMQEDPQGTHRETLAAVVAVLELSRKAPKNCKLDL